MATISSAPAPTEHGLRWRNWISCLTIARIGNECTSDAGYLRKNVETWWKDRRESGIFAASIKVKHHVRSNNRRHSGFYIRITPYLAGDEDAVCISVGGEEEKLQIRGGRFFGG